MAEVITKLGDNTLRITKTIEQVQNISIDELIKQRDMVQAQLDDLNNKINQGTSLGVKTRAQLIALKK